MTRVHILSERPNNQNTRAFLAPIFWNRRRIFDRGITIRTFFEPTDEIGDCDVLAINGKYWRGPWEERQSEAINWLYAMEERVSRILFYDRSSTAGHLAIEVLEVVDAYYKTSLFKDRSIYLKSLYGTRLFSDYYHRKLGVSDETPVFSAAVPRPELFEKLHCAWNTGLANYSLFGPHLGALYSRVPVRALLAPPRRYSKPSSSRIIELSCRMETSYKYKTLAYQRQETARLLSEFRRIDRVSKPIYFKELRESKVVASPFGSSEINYRDFEVFICGALLLKPDMSHLETYPNFYLEDETYVAHGWDLDDLVEKVAEILSNYKDYMDIARNGQEMYRHHAGTKDGWEEFVDRFALQINGKIAART